MTLPKNLSFNSFLNVDYTPGQDPLIKRMAKKRKGNETETSGPSEAVEVEETTSSKIKKISQKEYEKIEAQHYSHGRPHHNGSTAVVHTPKGTMGYKGAGHLYHDKKTNQHVTQTGSHPDHEIPTIEKRIHMDTKKVTYHKYVDRVKEAVEVEEAILTPAQRRLRALQMKRLAPKLHLGQERAKARFADPERLKRRALKAARTMIFRKLTKGIPKDELTYQRRQEIEKRLATPAMKARIERIAIKMLPKEREAEVARHRQQGQDEKK